MPRRYGHLVLIVLMAAFTACDSAEEKARKEPLLAAETFHWCDVPLAFRPPPVAWERQKHNQGGLRGIWFTHRGSVGERIYISEFYKVGERSLLPGQRIPYSLDDVVAETRFSTIGWPIPADSFAVAEMQPDTVAGVPAYRLEFNLHTPERRQLVGREYYFLQQNHLFEAAYLGLPENLPLFERIVESITFPPVEEP